MMSLHPRRGRCNLRLLAGLVGIGVGLVGCGSTTQKEPFTITVRSTVDGEIPLEGVAVITPTQVLGVTDAEGSFSVTLNAEQGTRVLLSAECPPGHRLRTQPRQLTLRRIQTLGDADDALHVAIECSPTQRSAALIVRAAGHGGLPILIDGDPAGELNSEGVAHFALAGPPQQRFEVRIDTATRENLRPSNPSRVIVLPDNPEIFIYEQTFVVEQPPEPVRRIRRRQSPATPMGPTRL